MGVPLAASMKLATAIEESLRDQRYDWVVFSYETQFRMKQQTRSGLEATLGTLADRLYDKVLMHQV
jgi:hypothetical protein